MSGMFKLGQVTSG